jgi:hypothetical protein
MTHHPTLPQHPHFRPLPVYHPKPVVRPQSPDYPIIPGRSGISPFTPIAHVSGNGASFGRGPIVRESANLGQQGTSLRGITHVTGSDGTRALLHAQSLIAAILAELAQVAAGKPASANLRSLQVQLDRDLVTIEGHKISDDSRIPGRSGV